MQASAILLQTFDGFLIIIRIVRSYSFFLFLFAFFAINGTNKMLVRETMNASSIILLAIDFSLVHRSTFWMAITIRSLLFIAAIGYYGQVCCANYIQRWLFVLPVPK